MLCQKKWVQDICQFELVAVTCRQLQWIEEGGGCRHQFAWIEHFIDYDENSEQEE